MRTYVMPLNTKPSGEAGPGDPLRVEDYQDKTIQIIGGAGTYDIEVSLNGTDFHPALVGLNTPGVHTLEYSCTHVRINASANTTAPTVLFAGTIKE